MKLTFHPTVAHLDARYSIRPDGEIVVEVGPAEVFREGAMKLPVSDLEACGQPCGKMFTLPEAKK